MVRAIVCTGACVAASVLLAGAMKTDGLSERARKLHFSCIVVDTHDDTTQRLLDGKFDLGTRTSAGSIDIPRMREGNVGAIFFSIWIPSKVTGPDAVNRAIVQIDAVREQVRKHPNDLVLATTAAEIRDAHKQGKIAALLGVEGGHMINSDLGVLRAYAALGVRYMTLTHSGNDEVSDKTFYDALETSKAPLIASHSSCRAICDAPRNMTDQMIKDLAAKGGVVQINYHVGFLSQEFRDAEKANPELNKTISAEVTKRCADNEGCQLIEGDRITREYVEQGRLPRVEFSKIIEHIDHAVKVAGIDHVGLGSDFDGANMPYGMEDAAKLPKITEALLQKGYAEGDVKKILGENTLRVMTDVQLISRELNGGKQKQESRLQ